MPYERNEVERTLHQNLLLSIGSKIRPTGIILHKANNTPWKRQLLKVRRRRLSTIPHISLKSFIDKDCEIEYGYRNIAVAIAREDNIVTELRE